MWAVWIILLVVIGLFVKDAALRIVLLIPVALMLLLEIVRIRYQPVVPGDRGTYAILLGGLIIGGFATAWIIRRFRRTRPAGVIVVLFVIAMVYGTACFGAIFGTLNGLLDRGPESHYVQRIVAVGRRYVEVEHWLPNEPPQRIFINKQQHQQIVRGLEESGEAGGYLEVTTRPGCFGAPWISSCRLTRGLPENRRAGSAPTGNAVN